MRNKLKNEYFKWLCNLVNFDSRYTILAKAMHRKSFYSLIDNDDNRGEDGKKIRDIFIKDKSYDLEYSEEQLEQVLGGPCSVFEMLVALSFRMEDVLYDCEAPIKSNGYFWELLHNLELDTFTDDKYDESEVYIVDNILDSFLQREYRRSGKGGLFPLKNFKRDQRKVEIWYQMMEYLTENYNI